MATAEEKAAAKAAKDAEKKAGDEAAAAEKAKLAEEKAAAKAAKADGPITVKYRDHTGETVERVFSAGVHGEEFADLAEQFQKTNASRLVTE